MTDSKITPAKLQACAPYGGPRGNFLQLPFTSFFEVSLNNAGGTAFLSIPGQEQAAPSAYDFLVHQISALVSAPDTYMRVQWPDGRYLSQTPVDIWSMIQTGRNGRLLGRPKFVEKNGVIRMEFGTGQAEVVNVQIFFEGALLIPA